MSAETELKCCPFCNKPGVAHDYEYLTIAPGCGPEADEITVTLWQAGCPDADCAGYCAVKHKESEREAAAAWNRRAPHPDSVLINGLERLAKTHEVAVSHFEDDLVIHAFSYEQDGLDVNAPTVRAALAALIPKMEGEG